MRQPARFSRIGYAIRALLLAAALPVSAADNWWNEAWTQRQTLTLDTGPDAAALTESPGSSAVLIRLHDGNFPFAAARTDGSDLRFVDSGGAVLPHEIEKYDNLLNEALVWVRLPDILPAAKSEFHLYFANAAGSLDPVPDSAAVWAGGETVVYHFGTTRDSTAAAVSLPDGAPLFQGALAGGGLRLTGTAPVVVPASPSLEWSAGQTLTWSAWIRPGAPRPQAIVWSRGDAAASVQLLLDNGAPVVEIAGPDGQARTAAGEPLAPDTWTHLAVVADAGVIRLLANASEYATTSGSLPALTGPIGIGGRPDSGEPPGGYSLFAGEIDEFRLSSALRSDASIALDVTTQGISPAAARALTAAAPENTTPASHSEMLEHVMLFGDIAANMMFDGWIAVGVCVIMILVGWTVAIRKLLDLSTLRKGDSEFLRLWRKVSSDLTTLDRNGGDGPAGAPDIAGKQALMKRSPLYHMYRIGSDEVSRRLRAGNGRSGLSGRSIQAIRASLDAGLVRETHRLNKGLVYLTISIAGGPYVGLLGTVVGVMITFAIIARSGEVDVNSIAPGIASALLATVAGLVVAIPALFIYSYLSTRIRESLGLMESFIDEFVARMAEFHPDEGDPPAAAAVPAAAIEQSAVA